MNDKEMKCSKSVKCASKKHPGFEKVSKSIAKEYEKKGVSPAKAKEIADATAAKVARNASPAAKKANPNLKHVKSGKNVKCACGKPMKGACKKK